MMSQEDPFAEVRVQKKNDNKNPAIQKNAEDPFEDVRLKKTEGFPWLYEGARQTARTASRIAETIGGIPGDVKSLLDSGVFSVVDKLVGDKFSDEEKELLQKESFIPTSSDLKKASEKVTKGFTTAQNQTEKIADEYVQTAASLFGPMKFRKALGVALGSQLAKEGVNISGFGEKSQEAAKLGTLLTLSMINPKGASKYAKKQFELADDLAKGASVDASKLESSLNELNKELNKGISTPFKTAVQSPTEELLKKINKGKISVQELTAAKRDINSLTGDPATLKGTKQLLRALGRHVDQALVPYEKVNPSFSKAYRPANEIHGAIAEGNKMRNFANKILGAKSIIGSTIGEIALGHPEYILPTFAGAAGAHGAARSYDFLTRLKKSPELRKFYIKGLAAAAKEDVSSLRLYEEKLQEELNKH